LLGTLLLLTVFAVARRHPAGFVGASFFLVLAPSSSVVPILTEVAAEHRMYLPLAAVIAAVIIGLFVAGRHLRLAQRPAVVVSALAVVAVVGSLGLATRERNRVYWSADSLWRDAVSVRPDDARPRVAYGEALASAGRLAEAEAQLLAAVALAPGDPVARVRLGVVLARERKFDAAVPHLEQALASRPGDVDAHRWLAEVYAVQLRDRLAVEHYEQALAALPDDEPLLAGLATILADSRDPSLRNPLRAKELASRAARLTGGRDPRVLEILAVAQAAAGQFAEAAATARSASGLARASGDGAFASALEYRASAYDAASRQFLPAGR
jgi:tetratricopeptide (TPR) repeat protein